MHSVRSRLGPPLLMLNLALGDFLLAVVVGFSGLALLVMRTRKRRLPYPPGPKRLPWVTYRRWSEQLGSDVIHADVMGSHIVIINSMKAANELLEKRSSIYSDRTATRSFGMDYNLGLTRYGPAWRHSRHLEEYQPLEKQAVYHNFVQHLRHMAGQVILERPYVADAENVLRAVAIATTKEPMLLDSIPWLIKKPSWFQERATSGCRDGTTSVAAKLISNLDENSTEEDLWISRATVSALQTFILAMTLYPEVQRKAQAEIDQVVGNSRLPDFSDEGALPYVQAVLKEVLRWHPVTPLGVPHRWIVSDIYEGYYIPAGSMIIFQHVVLSAASFFYVPTTITIIPRGIMHDPAIFAEPDRFYPEAGSPWMRRLSPNQAFGFGARQCPGRFLARASMWSNIAGILAAFDIYPYRGRGHRRGRIHRVLYRRYVKPFRCNIVPRSAAAVSEG
ncbi:cytochrome P450 [Lactarius hengduanensis]|nr:cytochrome P450 [Lactarius hengduanensis]